MPQPVEPAPAAPLRPPPPLPPRLLALAPIVYVGTAVWLVAAIALAIAHFAFDTTPATWLWTSIAGVGLGIVGAGIMTWQRSAAKRGSKSAQKVD